MRKSFLAITLALLSLFFISSVRGSGKEGHGGSAVVCRTASGAIESVELLDLWEGRNQEYRLTIGQSNEAPEQQARDLVERLLQADRDYFDELPGFLESVIAKVRLLDPGVGVEPVNDVFPVIHPKACKIEPLANYQDDGTVLVDSDFFSHLSPTGKAGLYLHEALYRLLRGKEHVTDSRKARRINAYLFSTLSDDAFTRWFHETHGDLQEDLGVDLKLNEEIGGMAIPGYHQTDPQKAEARADYDRKCEAWKAATRERFKNIAVYVYPDCGKIETMWHNVDGVWSYQVLSHGIIHARPKGRTLTIHETIRTQLVAGGDAQNVPPQAITNYHQACRDWKAGLQSKFGKDLFYADCGDLDDGSWIANAYYYDGSSQRAYWLGYEPHSRGSFVIFVKGKVDTDSETMEGQRYYFTPGDIAGEANAFQWARYDYAQKCNRKKAEVAASSRGIYVDCEAASSEIQDHPYATSYTIIDNNYWMRASVTTYRYADPE